MQNKKNNMYREEMGVYFIEETNGTNTESLANKTEKKVITYYYAKGDDPDN